MLLTRTLLHHSYLMQSITAVDVSKSRVDYRLELLLRVYENSVIVKTVFENSVHVKTLSNQIITV